MCDGEVIVGRHRGSLLLWCTSVVKSFRAALHTACIPTPYKAGTASLITSTSLVLANTETSNTQSVHESSEAKRTEPGSVGHLQ